MAHVIRKLRGATLLPPSCPSPRIIFPTSLAAVGTLPWLQRLSQLQLLCHLHPLSLPRSVLLDSFRLFLTLDSQASKFKPPRSFASVKRDPPPSSTPALPYKRLSSDPETPPPSSVIQVKRPRCHTGSEKENLFSQETPLGGVTNLAHRSTPASPQRKVVEFIEVDDDPPPSPSTTYEFVGVSETGKGPLACAEYALGN